MMIEEKAEEEGRTEKGTRRGTGESVEIEEKATEKTGIGDESGKVTGMEGGAGATTASVPLSRTQRKKIRKYHLKKVVNVRTCAFTFRQLFTMYQQQYPTDKIHFTTFYLILRYKVIHPRHGTDMCNVCEEHKARKKRQEAISFFFLCVSVFHLFFI
jgi:hypothetical protein